MLVIEKAEWNGLYVDDYRREGTGDADACCRRGDELSWDGWPVLRCSTRSSGAGGSVRGCSAGMASRLEMNCFAKKGDFVSIPYRNRNQPHRMIFI